MFCVECGRKKPIYSNGVCIDCYIKNKVFTSGPEKIDIDYCSHCGSYRYQNTWLSDIFDDVLRRFILKEFDISSELEHIDIATECKQGKEGAVCKIFITGDISDKKVSEEHNLCVNLKKTVCDVCSKRFGGYHEAVIQVRGDKRDLTEDEINNIFLSVEGFVESLQAKGNRGLFITDYGKIHGGFDFFLSDKSAAGSIVKKLQEEYGGEIKTSSKNIGMKDSRQIYRMTYLLRLAGFKKGDFVSIDKKKFYVSSLSANKIHLIDLSNWDIIVFDSKKIDNIKVLGSEDLVEEAIVVSQNDKEIQLMNKKGYNTFEIKKPKKIFFDSDIIKFVRINDDKFLFPEKKHN